ncbi:MAG TPA: GNAT family N-acetyltransferase [Bacteroidia bacterium]|nr:GNAT family N-acetyltransferase [Bacteroidia bacterium]
MPEAEINWQPELVTPLLNTRALQAGDFDTLFAVASDPDIWQQHPEPERYKPEVFRKFFDSGLESGGALLLRDNKNQEVIGSSRYYGYSSEERTVSIGYTFLAKRCWGHTYNAELKRAMMAYAFMYCESIYFHVGEHNTRSRLAIGKIGGVLQSIDKGTALYVIRKEDWTS